MSLLQVDEIRDEAGSTTAPPSIPGLQSQICQAWVNFDTSSVVSIYDSYNVTSITDNGIGTIRINYTTPLTDANYSMAGIVSDSGDTNPRVLCVDSSGTKTVTGVDLTILNASGTGGTKDVPDASVIIFGGIA